MEEVWKWHITAYYEVSNLGRIRSVDRIIKSRHGTPALRKGKLCKQTVDTKGYLTVIICKDGVQVITRVHRIVAIAFLGLPENDELVVNHKDGNKLHNCYTNLEWVTQSQNLKHGHERRRRKKA